VPTQSTPVPYTPVLIGDLYNPGRGRGWQSYTNSNFNAPSDVTTLLPQDGHKGASNTLAT
jgi:hypothetical protein